MEQIILNGKCSKCLSHPFANTQGVGIFCTPFSQDGVEHIVITDRDASTCEYFQEIPEAIKNDERIGTT
jgi:hypothetical protein